MWNGSNVVYINLMQVMSLSDMLYKSIDWFLYNEEHWALVG